MSSLTGDQREKTPTDANSRDLIFYCTVCFASLAGVGGERGDPPYWLTSCGHIICSEHLFPNGVPDDATKHTHNCPHCERSEIALVGVKGGELPPEGLRDYFMPQSELLENFAGALRFQYENAVRAANHFKRLSGKLNGKLENQKSVLLKVRDELLEARELKKRDAEREEELVRLRDENEQYRIQLGESPARPRGAQLEQNTRPGTSPTNQQNSGSKRKADSSNDGGDRVRDFRRELNGRTAMAPSDTRPPPPAIMMPPPPPPKQQQQLQQLLHNPPSSQTELQPQQAPKFTQSSRDPPELHRIQTPNPAFQRPNNYSAPPRTPQFSNSTWSENTNYRYPPPTANYNPPSPNYNDASPTFLCPHEQPQSFSQNIPPSTPRRPSNNRPFLNVPYRSPLRPSTGFNANSLTQLQGLPLQNVISPAGNGAGRFSLLPQSSHGRAFGTPAPQQQMGLQRPMSVSRPYFSGGGSGGFGNVLGVGGGGGGGEGLRPVFGAQFLGARQGSVVPESRAGGRLGGTSGGGGGGGGLNAILQQGGGSGDGGSRSGLRRAVRGE